MGLRNDTEYLIALDPGTGKGTLGHARRATPTMNNCVVFTEAIGSAAGRSASPRLRYPVARECLSGTPPSKVSNCCE